MIGSISLVFGSVLGLFIGYIADKTRIAPYFYASYALRGVPLIILAKNPSWLTEKIIITCFVAL